MLKYIPNSGLDNFSNVLEIILSLFVNVLSAKRTYSAKDFNLFVLYP